MSIHPSLRDTTKSKKHQSVLTRLERLLHLIKKDEWTEKDSVFGLPKIKVMKFKIKKEKAKDAEEGEVAAGAEGTEAAAGASTAEGKKPEAVKGQKEPGKDKK